MTVIKRNTAQAADLIQELVKLSNWLRQQPSLGRVAVVAFHDDSNGETSYMQCDTHKLHLLSERVGQPPAPGGCS